MELKEAAQAIRDTVNMDTVLSLYGYQPKHGTLHCPFHAGDHTASLKIYPGGGGWFCFGCGRGGSVIDFVMEQEGCNFGTAIKAIDSALNLHLFAPENPIKADNRREFMRCVDDLAALLMKQIADEERMCEVMLAYYTKQTMEIESIPKHERTATQITALQNTYEGMYYLEYRKEVLNEQREVVRKWQRGKRIPGTHRKAQSA